jgi:hypothetical protein
MRSQRTDEVGKRIAEECEALVEGRSCEVLGARGRTRPAWAWLNLPAHGLEADLRDLRRALDEEPPPNGSWQAARDEVCRIALVFAPEWGGLRHFQRDVLVPLELDLLGGDVQARTPAALIVHVLLRLEPAGAPSTPPDGS